MADEERKTAAGQTPAEEEAPMKISRRDFLIGAGAGVVVTGVVAGGYIATRPAAQPEVVQVPGPAAPAQTDQQAPAEAATKTEAPAPAEQAAQAAPVEPGTPANQIRSGKQFIVLNVNGRDYEVAVEPQMTLAEVLRRDLGLTGTHIGCNGSYCSNCTVLLDGVAENSCSLLAIREAGRKITTIEGLVQDGELHPVQQAFWEQMGYQCGFCTSGQIMRTVELLNKIDQPTEAQIRRHMSGNMCKCSAYPNIVRAIQKAAEMMA